MIRAVWFALALALVACGGAVDDAPEPKQPVKKCETCAHPTCSVHEAPTTGVQACLVGFQTFEYECDAPVLNPDGEACRPAPGPDGIMREVDGKAAAWCCK